MSQIKYRGFSLNTLTNRRSLSSSRDRPGAATAFSPSEKHFVFGLLAAAFIFFSLVSYFSDHGGRVVRADRFTNNPRAVAGSVKNLKVLLASVAAKRADGRPWVVVIAVNFAYRDFAMNFICNLNRLGITNYIALAMDRPVFDHMAKRGANVFFAKHSHKKHHHAHANGHGSEDMHPDTHLAGGKPVVRTLADADTFGTIAFLETSRRKSLLVLKVLHLGYDVLFSDVDVVWVRNPIRRMASFPSDIVLQSDTRFSPQARPLNYNVNSGLYFARSNPRTIRAFLAIIKYSQAIRRSEQKAFNYVLCGAFKDDEGGPGMRIGRSNCIYRRAGTSVHLLSSIEFPNGSNEALWNAALKMGKLPPAVESQVVAIHANYVRGSVAKKSRIEGIGFWKYDLVSGCSLTDSGT